MRESLDDRFLEGWRAKYDMWMEERKIPFSAKVIPVGASFSAKQWVMPTAQVFDILRNARSFAVAKCICRTHYDRCDNPREVCFLVNDVSDKFVVQGRARRLTLEEAAALLKKASEAGLVHLTLHRPDQYGYAVCSCCPCCCHDLQLLLDHGRDDLVVGSDYVAQTATEACTHCGACIDRCIFGARSWNESRMVYNPERCYGCGLCVSVCPEEATDMVLKRTLNAEAPDCVTEPRIQSLSHAK